MLDGIKQPGDRRLLADIAATPDALAEVWTDGYSLGLKNGRKAGYVDAMLETVRLLIDVGAGTANELVRIEVSAIAEVLLGKAKQAINQGDASEVPTMPETSSERGTA